MGSYVSIYYYIFDFEKLNQESTYMLNLYNGMDNDDVSTYVYNNDVTTCPNFSTRMKNEIKENLITKLYEKRTLSITPCSVCYVNMIDDDDVVVTACDHTFHTECIHNWINADKYNGCPMCRNKIT